MNAIFAVRTAGFVLKNWIARNVWLLKVFSIVVALAIPKNYYFHWFDVLIETNSILYVSIGQISLDLTLFNWITIKINIV